MLVPFYEVFPEVAKKETRRADIESGDRVGEAYLWTEFYCPDPACDCQKVTFQILDVRDGKHVATVSHFFDADHMQQENWESPTGEQTYHEPMGVQSEVSEELFELTKMLVSDDSYAKRLQRHYQMVKEADVAAGLKTTSNGIELSDKELGEAKKKLARQRRKLRGSARRNLKKAAKISRYKADRIVINPDWQQSRLATICQMRAKPDGKFALAMILVDLDCLGPKQAIFEAGLPRAMGDDYLQQMPQRLVDCDPNLAAKIVQRGALLATHLGFEIPAECFPVMALFNSFDPDRAEQPVRLGSKGKPVFMSGPDDDSSAIIEHLTDRLGPQGFEIITP